MDSNNSIFQLYKNTKNNKIELLNKMFEISLPEKFKEYLKDHNVLLNFTTYDKKFLKEFMDEYKSEIAKYISIMFDFGAYYNPSTKYGKQSFLFNKEDDWVKGWKDYSNKEIEIKNPIQQIIRRKNIEKHSMLGILENHFFSRWMPFKYSSKVFGNFFYRASAISDFYIPDGLKIQFDYKKHKDIAYWQYISLKNKVSGYSQNKNSKVLIIDIDKDTNDEKFYKCLELLCNPKLLYAEKSKYSNGWHLAVIYDKPIEDNYREELERFCKKHDLKIECCFFKHFIQLFGSIDYSPIDIEIFEKQHRFRFMNQLSLPQMIYVYNCTIYRYLQKIENRTDKLIQIINGSYNKFNELLEEETSTPIQVKSHNYDYIEKFPARYSNKLTKEIKLNYNKLNYIEAEAGDKFKALYNNIKVAVLKYNILDVQEIKNILTQYQGTSKTIANISDKEIERQIKYVLQNSNQTISSSTKIKHFTNITNFNSNLNLLPNKLKIQLNTLLYSFSESYYNNSIKLGFYKDKTKSKKEDIKTIAKYLLCETLGHWIYQIQNPTTLHLPKKLQHLFNMNDFTGLDINNTFIKLCLDDLKQKNIITHSFNFRTIREIFITTLQLKTTFIYNHMNSSTYNTNNVLDFYQKDLPLQFKFKQYNNVDEFIDNFIIDHLKPFMNDNISLEDIKNLISNYSNILKENPCYKFNNLNMNYVKSFFDEIKENNAFIQNNAPPD